MRLLAIRGAHLASLGPFAVELGQAPLADSRIFAIVGPTGAGKSTLLDAVCLALYDRVPRLLSARDAALGVDDLSPNDPRAVMRRGAVEAFAEVDFVDRRGQRLRARWDVWRARKRPDGRVQNQRITLTDLDAGRELTEATKTETLRAIEDRLGLSFEEFRRAVLLAQGDFAAFLRAPADERAHLLEKMTGTHIFGALSRAAHARHKTVADDLARRETERDAVHVLEEAVLARLLDERHQRQQARAAHAANKAEADEMVRWHDEEHRALEAVKAAATGVTQARTAVQEAEADQQTLARAEAAATLREPYEAWARADGAATETVRQLRLTEAAFADAEHVQAEARAAVEQAEQRRLHIRTQRARAADDLAAARQLDGRLAQTREALEAADRRVEHRAEDAAEAHTALEEALSQYEAAVERAGALRAWLEEHASLQRIAIRWTGIAQALERAEVLRQRITEATAAAEDLGERLERAQGDRHQAAAAREAAHGALSEAQAELQSLSTALTDIRTRVPSRNRREAMETLSELRAGLERLRSLLPNARRLARRAREEQRARRAAIGLARDARDRYEQARREGAEARSTWESLQQELGQREAVHAVTHRRRELLTDNAPCPLCGATGHPFADCAPTDDPRLNALRTQRAQLKDDFRRAKEAADAARDAVRTHRAAAKEALARAQEAQADLDLVASTWSQGREALKLVWLRSGLLTERGVHKLYLHIDERPTAKRAQFGLQSALDGLDAARKDLTEWADKEDELQQAVEATRVRADRREAALKEHAERTGRLDADLTRLQHQQAQLADRRSAADSELHDVLSGLAGVLAHAVAIDEVRRAPAAVARSLAEQVSTYEAKNAEAQSQQAAVAPLEETMRTARAAADQSAAALRDARDQAVAARERHEQLSLERQGRLGGRPVAAFEAEMTKAEAETEAELRRAQARSARASADFATAGGRHEEAVRRHEVEAATRDQAEVVLQQALQDSGFDREALAHHLQTHDPKWQAATRARLQAVRDDLTRAEAQAEAAERRLATHRSTGRPAVDAATATATAQASQAQLEAEISALGQIAERLRLNEQAQAARRKLDAEVGAQRLALEDWAELDAVIGSADGKKLRTFAQGLTLESLLAEANVHLQELRPRYRLGRVPGQDMDLMVIDRDLGDEPRALSSLSGGETFLVSLALALALSTLSSRNVRIESLFIDEGFGALDGAALEVALATLDQLQAEGRTIGLISHLPDLAERIGYRVEVRPTGPGLSSVSVVGA